MSSVGYTTMMAQMERGSFTEVGAKDTINRMYACKQITSDEYEQLLAKADELSPNTSDGEFEIRFVAIEKDIEALKKEVDAIKEAVETGDTTVTIPDESATGEYDDPIEAYRGMVYYKDKYYKDPEDGQIYKCYRDSDTDPGTGIALYFLPHELVNLYFHFDRVP